MSNLRRRAAQNNSDYIQNSPSVSISPQNSGTIPETSNIFENNLNNIKMQRLKEKALRYGMETISYRISLLWANLPDEYKHPNSLNEFESKIQNWKCDTCFE